MQIHELREYAERRGWKVAGEYVDVGVSGKRDRRPELDRLWVDARRRRFDAVLVWKLDRFGRSLRHLVNSLAEFEALGVAFVSLRDSLDLSTPAGRLMAQLLGAIAEFERSLIVERVRAGMANAKRKGKRIGRKPADVDEAEVMRLVGAGISRREIGHRLGVSEATVRRVLARLNARDERPAADTVPRPQNSEAFVAV